MPARLSVIIPTLNEALRLPACLEGLARHWPDAEVVVADGGSTDATCEIAASAGARVLTNLPRSRGEQLRAGAAATRGNWLFFLHADSMVGATAAAAADRYRLQGGLYRLAMFQIQFDQPTPLLRFSSWWTRFDSVFTRFGDQGILIRRDYYDGLGGFKPWPLFEDVDLLRRARRDRSIDVLPATISTSSRRFVQRGPCRQQLSNGWLLLRFLLGTDPHVLVNSYRPVQEGSSGS